MTDAPVDPLSGPGFDALWTGQIEPQLLALEGERRRAMRRSMMIWSAFAGLVAIEALLTGWLSDGRTYTPSPYVLFFTVMAAVLTGFGPLNKVGLKVKARVLQTLCAPMGVTYQAHPVNPPAFDRLVELNLLPASLDRNFDGVMQGRRGDVDFLICETRATLRSGAASASNFQGQLFAVTFPRRMEGTTVLLRETGWQTRFECPKGLERIGLENPTFDRILGRVRRRPGRREGGADAAVHGTADGAGARLHRQPHPLCVHRRPADDRHRGRAAVPARLNAGDARQPRQGRARRAPDRRRLRPDRRAVIGGRAGELGRIVRNERPDRAVVALTVILIAG